MAHDPEQHDAHLDKLIGLFDGACSADRLDEMSRLIESDPELQAFYLEYVEMHVLLRRRFGVDRTPAIEGEDPFDWHEGFDAGLLADLVADERSQQHTRVLDEAEARALASRERTRGGRGRSASMAGEPRAAVREVVIPKPLFYGVLIAASLAILLLLSPMFVGPAGSPSDPNPGSVAQQPPATPAPPPSGDALPAEPAPAVAARVIDQIDARWASAPPTDGLVPGDQAVLHGGLARLRFAQGAEVVLQGPARIEVVSDRSIVLLDGRLVGSCRTAASRGFTVDTPVGRLIDIGTEFGLAFDAGTSGMITQVFEGSVLLAAVDQDGAVDASRVVKADEAAQLDQAGVVHPLAWDAMPVQFTREVTRRIDLVDVVAGGDGRGSGWDRGVDPRTGRWYRTPPAATRWQDFIYQGDGRYHAAAGSPFVDGVFIPSDQLGDTQIDSTGTTTDLLPATSGYSYGGVWAGGTIPNHIGPDVAEFSTAWGGVDYAQRGRGLLALHSNQGITFDLHALGRSAGGLVPHAFQAQLNMAAQIPGRQVDVFIFVDGELLFERRGFSSNNAAVPLDLPLPHDARFLTLVTTEGPDGRSTDWLFYGEPGVLFATNPQDQHPPRSAE